jgi:hypothetical protein
MEIPRVWIESIFQTHIDRLAKLINKLFHLVFFILVGERRQMLKRCQDMKAISGNLGGPVASRYIVDNASPPTEMKTSTYNGL